MNSNVACDFYYKYCSCNRKQYILNINISSQYDPSCKHLIRKHNAPAVLMRSFKSLDN